MTTIVSFQVSSDIEKSPPIETDLTAAIQPPASGNPGNPHKNEGGTPKDQHEKEQIIQLTKRLQVINPDKETIYDTGDTPCKSFVVAFIRALWSCFTRRITTSHDIYGNRTHLIDWGWSTAILINLNARPGETRFGPVVGSGLAPLSDFDHRLDAQIPHGTATGQLAYENTSILEPVRLRGAMTLIIIRTFTNLTTADITITECGIYGYGASTRTPRFHCFIRDLVDPAITVPPEHAILLEYKILTRV